LGEKKGAYRVSVGKHEGKRPLEEVRVDGNKITMNLEERVWKDVNWTYLAQDTGT
jgi:RNase P/RNase MRP subunit p29